MDEREKQDLERLDRIDLWIVVNTWRLLLWRQDFTRLPLAGRLGLINFILLVIALFILPSTDRLPTLFLPLLWMGSYCLSLSISVLLPLRRRSIHWVGR